MEIVQVRNLQKAYGDNKVKKQAAKLNEELREL